MINYFAIGILMFLGWAFVWSIIDRICTCKERCANAKAFTRNLTIDGKHVATLVKEKGENNA